jgi:hypothetical protein
MWIIRPNVWFTSHYGGVGYLLGGVEEGCEREIPPGRGFPSAKAGPPSGNGRGPRRNITNPCSTGWYLSVFGGRQTPICRPQQLDADPPRNHWSGTRKQAAFAFKLARERTGFTNPTYQRKGSRDDLMTRPEFVIAFAEARTRIGKMDLRYVEETDELRQCLLEVYVSIVLGTPYNRWDTT